MKSQSNFSQSGLLMKLTSPFAFVAIPYHNWHVFSLCSMGSPNLCGPYNPGSSVWFFIIVIKCNTHFRAVGLLQTVSAGLLVVSPYLPELVRAGGGTGGRKERSERGWYPQQFHL